MHGKWITTCRAVAFFKTPCQYPVTNDKISQRRDDLHFKVLYLLESWPALSQREIAEEVGASLGAVNFCVKTLIAKGHITLANFKASKNKLGHVYILTSSGIANRARLAACFIERKVAQYEAIRAELDQLHSEFSEDIRN
jgi:EPS-associated MarR family transcriptional regulator